MNSYSDQTLTINDLGLSEEGSVFTNVIFNGEDISGKKFSFSVFNDCTFNMKFIGCDFVGAEGNSIPSGDAVDECLVLTGEDAPMTRSEWLESRRSRLLITTNATDTASPMDGIPDIAADDVSTCQINIQKQDADGNDLTGSGETDQVDIVNTRGKLSSLRVNLVNGAASVTLTSVPETVVSDISASSDQENVDDGSIRIQFAPV